MEKLRNWSAAIKEEILLKLFNKKKNKNTTNLKETKEQKLAEKKFTNRYMNMFETEENWYQDDGDAHHLKSRGKQQNTT